MLGRESPEAGIVGPASRVPSARPVGRSQRTHLPTHDGLLSGRPQVTIVRSKEVVIQREPCQEGHVFLRPSASPALSRGQEVGSVPRPLNSPGQASACLHQRGVADVTLPSQAGS